MRHRFILRMIARRGSEGRVGIFYRRGSSHCPQSHALPRLAVRAAWKSADAWLKPCVRVPSAALGISPAGSNARKAAQLPRCVEKVWAQRSVNVLAKEFLGEFLESAFMDSTWSGFLDSSSVAQTTPPQATPACAGGPGTAPSESLEMTIKMGLFYAGLKACSTRTKRRYFSFLVIGRQGTQGPSLLHRTLMSTALEPKRQREKRVRRHGARDDVLQGAAAWICFGFLETGRVSCALILVYPHMSR